MGRGVCARRARAETLGTSGSDSARGRLGEARAEMPASWCVRTKTRARQRQFLSSTHCGFCFLSGAWLRKVPAPAPRRPRAAPVAHWVSGRFLLSLPSILSAPSLPGHGRGWAPPDPHTCMPCSFCLCLTWHSEPFCPFLQLRPRLSSASMCHPCVWTSFPERHSWAAAQGSCEPPAPSLDEDLVRHFPRDHCPPLPA